MNMHNVNIVARYEAKLLRRDIVFLGFVVLAMVGISLWQMIIQGGNNVFWYKVALSSSFPFFSTYYYNLVQVLIALFVCMEVVYRERKKDAMEVFLCRPLRNSEYCIGRFWGIFRMFLFVNICVLLVCMYLNIWVVGSPFEVWVYVFYLLTLSIPTLIFALGCSLGISEIVRNRPVSVLVLGMLGLGVYFYLGEWQFGVFDFWGRNLPNMFSDVTGHPDLYGYLLQRLAYVGLGIAGILFWIANMKRLRDGKEYRGLQWGTGGAITLCSMVCLFLYWDAIRQREIRSEEYRQVYVEYQLRPRARVVNHEITYEWKDGEMWLDSRMTLQNRNQEALSSIVLYLNPLLEIYSMKEVGNEIGYHRKQQVVVLERSLLPGDSISLQLSYKGKIDETICYLDVSRENQQNAGRYDPRLNYGMFNFGAHYAFAREDYTLLHPECLWYPVAVPPINMVSPYAREVNFTDYSLRVKVQEGQQAISQGVPEYSTREVFFRNEQKLSGITLCIGDYHKKEVDVGGVRLEFYYFPGHEFFFDQYTQITGENISKELEAIKGRLEARMGRNYPFRKLMFVESPLSFVSFLRKWKAGSDFVQPEIVFFNERAVTVSSYTPMSRRKNLAIEREKDILNDPEGIYSVERMGLQSVGMYLQQGLYDILPMYYDYTSFLSSATYPAMNMLFSKMFASKKKYTTGNATVRPNDIDVIEHLKKKSLREILSNDSLPDKLQSRVFEMEGTTFGAYLSAFVEPERLYRFSEEMASCARFDEITLSQFAQDFQSDFGVNLIPILDKLYQREGIPAFDVRDIRVEQIIAEGFPQYLVSFKVRNISDVDGVISIVADDETIEELRSKYGDGIIMNVNFPVKEQHYVIPAGACKGVKFIMNGDDGYIGTNLSANLPRDYNIRMIKEGISKTKESSEGIFDIDCGLFENPHEIIVDNRSDRFQLIDSGERKRLPFLAKERKVNFKMSFDNPEWTEIITEGSYGIPVRSAFCKVAGKGGGKAIWTADIEEAGKYEVFFYHQTVSVMSPPASSVFTGSLLHYKVMDKEVIVEADLISKGWVSLGKFDLQAGETQVTLDDRGGEIRADAEDDYSNIQVYAVADGKSYPKRQLIVADAVKWVRVKE
ncbi:hypothetical protein [Odoribacter sp. AF15-53]|mgnify:FL=1|uniref:hypothetical protein n=1 Tax=Odoribacter sp. AF15-53 TaxID=2292236 RepID=UPI000E4FA256|nr:hypothetical protein [Odoribacter sp. AF15-53]RHR78987.1 hypothetical protein DWW52_10430 [Odoribacter sp. AF15-53]